MFNWRPVYDIEQRSKLVENEIVQLKLENKRLAELESREDASLLNAASSSQTPPSTGSS
jgi:hypothetical protein